MFDFLSALEQTTSLLSIEQVAEMVGVHHQTVRRWIKQRYIPSVVLGGLHRFDPKTLYWWYAKRSPEALKAHNAMMPVSGAS